jgi:hypothetical protein
MGSAVTSVTGGLYDTVADTAQTVRSAAIDTVQDTAAAVYDNVVSPVATVATDTIKAAAADPIGTMATVATAIVAPELLPLVSAGNTLAKGGDLGDALKSAAVTYVAQGVGQYAGGVGDQATAAATYGTDLGSQQTAMLAAQEAGMGTVNDLVGNSIGSTAANIVRGQDPLTALTNGGINAGTAAATAQIPGFESLTAAQQRAVNSVVAAKLAGGDPSQALINSAISAGISEARQYTPDSTTAPPSGVNLASADTGTMSDADAPYTVSIGGVPIYAESSGAGNVSAPYGYDLMSMSQADQRPEGAYYDATQNAWFTPNQEVQQLQDQLTLQAGDQTEGTIPEDTLDPFAITGDISGTPSSSGADTTGAGADTTGAGADTTGAGADTTGAGADTTGAGADTGTGTEVSPGTDTTTPIATEAPAEVDLNAATSDLQNVYGGELPIEDVAAGLTDTTTPTTTPTTTSGGTGISTIGKALIAGLPATTGGTSTAGGTTPTQAPASSSYVPMDNPVYKNAYSDMTLLNPVLFSLTGLGPASSSTRDNPLNKPATALDVSFGTSFDNPVQNTFDAPTEWFSKGGLAGASHPMGEPQYYSEGALTSLQVKGDGDGTSDDIPAMVARDEYVLPADIVSSLGNGSSDAGASVLDQFVRQIRTHRRSNDPGELPPDSAGPLEYLTAALSKGSKHGRNL